MRRRVVPLRGSMRRRTGWEAGPDLTLLTLTQATTTNVLWTTGQAATLDGLTIVRVRGQLLIQQVSATGNDDGAMLAFGLGVTTAEAFAAGAAAVPSAFDDMDDDIWLWHQLIPMCAGTTAVPFDSVGSGARIEIDSKAMRKMNEGDVLFGCLQSNDEDGVYGYRIRASSRVLLKIP